MSPSRLRDCTCYLLVAVLFGFGSPAAILCATSSDCASKLLAHNTSTLPSVNPGPSFTDSHDPSLHRFFVLHEFRDDLAAFAHDPMFYSIMSGMIATPFVMKHEDPEINEMLAGEHGTAETVFEAGNTMGSGVFPFSAAALSYGLGKILHSDGATAFASDLFRAQVLNGIATLGLKTSINRTRPDGGSWSFPSGHASTCFTTAAVIYSHFGPEYGIPAYLAATYVGLSRLQANRHYPSDVLAGAVLGSYIGFKVSGRKRDDGTLTLFPTWSNGTLGAGFSLRF
jgi:membrane-associated phospholipid phosphatase